MHMKVWTPKTIQGLTIVQSKQKEKAWSDLQHQTLTQRDNQLITRLSTKIITPFQTITNPRKTKVNLL